MHKDELTAIPHSDIKFQGIIASGPLFWKKVRYVEGCNQLPAMSKFPNGSHF